jgi:hypothetical protein
MKQFVVIFLSVILWCGICAGAKAQDPKKLEQNRNRIKPYAKNPRYWQYKGKPVLLLGGSKTDHIFLAEKLKEHLDEMQAVGANYVRCTMSQREGLYLKPHKLLPDGKFDLDQWNTDYWNRFTNCLKWCHERDIIIQIEVWDRFDYTNHFEGWNKWKHSPWHPDNNVNYTNEQTGLADSYPHHPGENKQPFFYTIPGTDRYEKRYDIIRHHQERFVDKMLSYSLKYPNVLYCMDNETSGAAEWGKFWSEWIKRRAAEAKVEVHTTEMWDAWDIKHDTHKRTYDHPETYSFIDISQNTHISGQVHWDNLSWVREYIAKAPRPMNNTKIYGADTGTYGKDRDAEERFWRNIIGGLASSRFHRPDTGLGLNDRAKVQIKSMRMLTRELDIFNCTPDQHGKLLADRSENEAFLTYIAGRQYAVYFPNGGSIQIDLSDATGSFKTKWLDITQSKWQGKGTVQGGRRVNLQSRGKGHWVVLISEK